jgi:CENP-B N-terminal DNA-binding domain
MSTDSKVKALLRETILTLCRGSIDFKSEMRIEAVIGITVDHDKVLLVSLHQTEKLGESVESREEILGCHVDKPSEDYSVKQGVEIENCRSTRVASNKCSRIKKNGANRQKLLMSKSASKLSCQNGKIELGVHNTTDMQFDWSKDAVVKQLINDESDSNLPLIGDVTDEGNNMGNTDSDVFIGSVQDDSREIIPDRTLKSNRKFKKFIGKSHAFTTGVQSKSQLTFAKRIEAIRMYEKIGSSLRVAKYLGITDGQVRRILYRKDELLAHASSGAEGIEFTAKKKRLTFSQRVEAIHLYDTLQSTNKVAQHFGVGATQIRDILKCRRELLSMTRESNERETTNS